MAREWGRFNVNVNAVAFGLIHTRMTSADAKAGATVNIEGREIRVGLNPEMLKTHAQRNPLGRGGTPEEAAGGVYLFCSPDSNYITGQVVAVAGNVQYGIVLNAGRRGAPCIALDDGPCALRRMRHAWAIPVFWRCRGVMG